MNLFEPVDIYCERLDATLWSEPLNAISNIAFFIAAWCAYRLYRTQGKHDAALLSLIGLLALVGVGSASFHTFANQITQLGDVIPIAMFVFFALWLIVRRLLHFNYIETAIVFAVFIFFAWQAQIAPPQFQFNGSMGYVPCLVTLWLIALALKQRKHPAAAPLLTASLLFFCSLTFRTIDREICHLLPIGTHYFWHALNGFVLFLICKSLILQRK